MSKIPAGSVWPAEGKAHVHPHAALYVLPSPTLFQREAFAPPHEGDAAHRRLAASNSDFPPSRASQRPAGVSRLALSGLSAGGSLTARVGGGGDRAAGICTDRPASRTLERQYRQSFVRHDGTRNVAPSIGREGASARRWEKLDHLWEGPVRRMEGRLVPQKSESVRVR